jgi:ribosomal protein S27AE
VRLTSTYTRVAMPPTEDCPHCGKGVMDWFREWYSDIEQRGFYKKLDAGDCPHCKKGVFIGYDLEAAPLTVKVLPRSRAAAEKWVALLRDPDDMDKRLFPDLDAFLNSGREDATDYQGYQFRP